MSTHINHKNNKKNKKNKKGPIMMPEREMMMPMMPKGEMERVMKEMKKKMGSKKMMK